VISKNSLVTPTPQAKEKGKKNKGQRLIKVLGKTNPDEVGPEVGIVPEPVKRTQGLRVVGPGTAPYHASAAIASARF
jgi:hypothetical protein